MGNTTQRFFDDGPDAICIADADLHIRHLNTAFERLLGYSREELQGSPLWNLVEPSRRETAERIFRAVPPEGVKRVWQFIVKDGSLKSLAIHFVRSPSGSHLATFHEVVQNREEDQNRLAAQRAMMFLEQAPNPMYEIDDAGVITLWNAAIAKLLGIPAAEALGKQSLELLGLNLTVDEMRRMHRELASTGKTECTATHQPRNGSPIHCVWSYSRMHDDVGKTLGVAITGIDMTDTLRRERELQESLEIIRRQRDDLRALSAPILEVWQNVLALPIIGSLDEIRASELMETLLDAISTRDCRFAILDLTGVAAIDDSSATHLVSILRAITLLGATGIVTGLRPLTAKAMVESGLDFAGVSTFPTLQAGLRHCLDELAPKTKPRIVPEKRAALRR